MKTSHEIKENIKSHVESCIQDNKEAIKEAFEDTKDNESITVIEYLEDLIFEASNHFADSSIIYYQDQWDIVYSFKFGFDQDYYENALERKYAEKDNISCGIMYRRAGGPTLVFN